ncbi:MAG: tryptophan--tRNA ligase [Tissierellia bacterium]|nr:tryptophan--tRNA ligase [Bacillota bacterium]NLL23036.1 tryptophan--tRNA ligase [Tissierellia bacterium]
MKKQRIFSGIQPSGNLTLGNYLGALRNWVALQEEYECIYSIVDMHAITVRQNPQELRERSLLTMALYLAAGLDPQENIVFIQSHVPEHAQLGWILGCNSYMGELSRMTQYKDKSSRMGDSIPTGLFNYPVLMAADILLYNAHLVPVGEDQTQHLELTRDIAVRFNNAYGETFVIPKGYFNPFGARIYDLQTPEKIMSKSSQNQQGILFLLDDEKTLKRKISRSVTDSLGTISYNDHQPGVKNLLNIFALLRELSIEESLAYFEGKGYKQLKDGVTEAVLDSLLPLQKKVNELMDNRSYLEDLMLHGAQRARALAKVTLADVEEKIGFIPRRTDEYRD